MLQEYEVPSVRKLRIADSFKLFWKAPLHRQYFHNKPLGIAQLDAWRHYLDFEEPGSQSLSHA